MTKGDTVQIRATNYVVMAVKPYPNAKTPVCQNVLIAKPDGSCKAWVADFALRDLAGPL